MLSSPTLASEVHAYYYLGQIRVPQKPQLLSAHLWACVQQAETASTIGVLGLPLLAPLACSSSRCQWVNLHSGSVEKIYIYTACFLTHHYPQQGIVTILGSNMTMSGLNQSQASRSILSPSQQSHTSGGH